jgi:hypothetical protein
MSQGWLLSARYNPCHDNARLSFCLLAFWVSPPKLRRWVPRSGSSPTSRSCARSAIGRKRIYRATPACIRRPSLSSSAENVHHNSTRSYGLPKLFKYLPVVCSRGFHSFWPPTAYATSPQRTTRLTKRPGTTISLTISRPSMCVSTFGAARHSAFNSSALASLGACTRSRSLPLTWQTNS